MPLKRCQSGGTGGWKWGDAGKCYTGENARKRALAQAIAMGDIEVGKDAETTMWQKLRNIFTMKKSKQELEAELVLLNSEFRRVVSQAEVLKEVFAEYGVTPENGLRELEIFALFDDTEAEKEDEPEQEEVPDLPGRGSLYPDVAFVGLSPSKLDVIRKKAFSGVVGKTLEDEYIQKSGLSLDRVYITNIVKEHKQNEDGKGIDPTHEEIMASMPSFVDEMNVVQPRFIVALGKKAHKYIGESAAEWVPHPRAINIMGNSGEVERKMHRLAKSIETPDETLSCYVVKFDEEQQLVTGVVMEPLENDTDMNWSTPDEIEKAAHFFMRNFRAIDTNHTRKDIDATPVESWIAREDTVLNGEQVKAGSWLMTVKVEDAEEWNRIKSGEYTGFSIDAMTRINPNAMLP